MSKLIKWLLGIVAFLAVLMVLAIVILPMVFDPNEHKPQIQKAAADAIGREVQLNGPIEWSVFPWVAINLNQVKVDNEQGFKGDSLAEIERVAVRVKLLPLLKKQIQVGQVELQQPTINLQVAKSGKSNWQSIVNRLSGGQETASESSGTDLEIRGVLLTGGELNYKDASADVELKLSDLKFESDAIKANQKTAMSLQADVAMPKQDMAGELSAVWQATGLSGGDVVMTFSDLSFSGKQGNLPLSLAAQSDAVVDLGQDTLSVNQLGMQYGALNANTSLAGKNLSTNMSLNGGLEIKPFSLAALLDDLGSPLDNQADNEFSGTTQWLLLGDRLKLSDMVFKLDDSNLTGNLDLRKLSELRGQFQLTIDQMNLDDYLPVASNSESAASSDSGDIDFGYLSGQIKMQKLTAAGVNLDDITLNIKTQGTNLTIEPLQADFYQGLIKTALTLQPDRSREKLKITHNMQDFQAGNLLTDLIGTDYLTGLGQLNADISIDQPFSEKPLQTANGRVSYRLSDGDIVGIDIYQIMQQSLSLLNKTDAAASNAELKTAFGLMEIDADVNNGVLKTRTLKLDSPYFNLNGEVEIDLDAQTIKGSIKPMLTNIPEGVLDSRFEKLINTRIPVSLKGSLLSPSVSIDLPALILATQKAKIDEKKEELKEDLFDAILGKKKDKSADSSDGANVEMSEKEKKKAEKDQLKRDLLEGLFKSKKKDQPNQDETGQNDGDGA